MKISGRWLSALVLAWSILGGLKCFAQSSPEAILRIGTPVKAGTYPGANTFLPVAARTSILADTPTVAGPYQRIRRFVRFNRAANAWAADSVDDSQVVILVTNSDGVSLRALKSSQFSFVAGDSVSRFLNQPDLARGFVDTVSIEAAWQGGQWVNKARYRNRIYQYPDGDIDVVRSETSSWDPARQWIVGSYFGRSISLDALQRVVRIRDSSFSALQGFSKFATDSSTYQDSSTLPNKRKFYTTLTTSAGVDVFSVWYLNDSLTYDTLGRPSTAHNTQFAFDNWKLNDYSYRYEYPSADTAISIYHRRLYSTTDSLAPPQQNYRKTVKITHPDSTLTLEYEWDGTAYQHITTWIIKQIKLSAHETVHDDSFYSRGLAGVWSKINGYKSLVALDSQGVFAHIYTYRFTVDSARYIPDYRIEYRSPSPLVSLMPAPSSTAFALAPNPARSFISILSSIDIDCITLTNPLGQRHTIPVQNHQANLSSLANGLYHVAAFWNGKRMGTARVVKE